MATKEESTSAPKKNGTVVSGCTCTNKYQDITYGSGRRLMNICAKGAKKRCTVCSKEYGI